MVCRSQEIRSGRRVRVGLPHFKIPPKDGTFFAEESESEDSNISADHARPYLQTLHGESKDYTYINAVEVSLATVFLCLCLGRRRRERGYP